MKLKKITKNSAAAASAAETKAALASALSVCEQGDALSSQLASSLAEADARGPRGRLRALLSELAEATALREREGAELSSLRGREEPQLRAALASREALAAEVAAAELRAKEVAARLPRARQLLTGRNAERSRLREDRERRRRRRTKPSPSSTAAARAGGGGGGGVGGGNGGGTGDYFMQERRDDFNQGWR